MRLKYTADWRRFFSLSKHESGRGQIQHAFYESPGTYHEWQTWRRVLKDFAPRLFDRLPNEQGDDRGKP